MAKKVANLPARVLCACATAAAANTAAAAAANQKRNILFLLEDDGSMDLGIYGNKAIATPRLDALASRGTTFDRFHSTVSSCSPSRAALMSGLPSHANGMYGLAHAAEHFASFAAVRGVQGVLNDAGYATGIIGKYHVNPASVYNFSYGNNPLGPGGCQAGASDQCPDVDYNFASRNITNMKEQAAAFLDYAQSQDQPFLLYGGFGDSHRCGGAVGEFCELYGLDAGGKSTIPDWAPQRWDPADVEVPFWIQDTPAARQDLAKLYTAKNRMDQGVGLLLDLLESRGLFNNTLIIYTADNGAPFAAGKTNQYEVAVMEPMIVSMPGAARVGTRSAALGSTLDLFPTFCEWAGVDLPRYSVLGEQVVYTGRSLLPFVGAASDAPLAAAPRHRLVSSAAQVAASAARSGAAPLPLTNATARVYGSFQLHEVQEYYPMRSVVAADDTSGAHYRLVYNIANRLTYPVAQDLWAAPAFQDLLDRTRRGVSTQWYRNFSDYLYTPRPQFELFDLVNDPQEVSNVAGDAAYAAILAGLQADILAWQTLTNDDWLIKRQHE
jgi:N-sulfoglucosamine sulfohydrolase